MSEETEDRRHSSWRYIAWAAFLILIVYPLSIGPALWLALKLSPDGQTWALTVWRMVYSPAAGVVRSFELGEYVYEPYLELFVGPL